MNQTRLKNTNQSQNGSSMTRGQMLHHIIGLPKSMLVVVIIKLNEQATRDGVTSNITPTNQTKEFPLLEVYLF